METIVAYPENPDKLKALKAFLKALKIEFEKSSYNPDFVAKIRRSDDDIKAGRTTKITPEDIWK
jgi:hypothetical protein